MMLIATIRNLGNAPPFDLSGQKFNLDAVILIDTHISDNLHLANYNGHQQLAM